MISKRRALYRIGLWIQKFGWKLERFVGKVAHFGSWLWDRNCDCVKCQERAKAKEGT